MQFIFKSDKIVGLNCRHPSYLIQSCSDEKLFKYDHNWLSY
jgi:hypothetical protein